MECCSTTNEKPGKKGGVYGFYAACVEEFHREGAGLGLLSEVHESFPDLLSFGEKLIISFFPDKELKKRHESDPVAYCREIRRLSLNAGIAAAWLRRKKGGALSDEDLSPAETERLVRQIRESLPEKLAADGGEQLCSAVFARWLELQKPFWKLCDSRAFTFRAMLAVYRLGLSIEAAALAPESIE